MQAHVKPYDIAQTRSNSNTKREKVTDSIVESKKHGKATVQASHSPG